MIGPVVVVDDEVQAREEIRTRGDHAFEMYLCRDRSEAMKIINSLGLVGIVIDVKLRGSDGNEESGLELLDDVRARWRTTPALVITGSRDPSLAQRATELGACFAHKHLDPDYLSRVEDFFNFVVSEAIEPIPALRAAVYQAAQSWGLRPHETVVLATHNHDHSRAAIGLRLGVPAETVKSRIASILSKSRHPTMLDLHYTLMAMARRNVPLG